MASVWHVYSRACVCIPSFFGHAHKFAWPDPGPLREKGWRFRFGSARGFSASAMAAWPGQRRWRGFVSFKVRLGARALARLSSTCEQLSFRTGGGGLGSKLCATGVCWFLTRFWPLDARQIIRYCTQINHFSGKEA